MVLSLVPGLESSATSVMPNHTSSSATAERLRDALVNKNFANTKHFKNITIGK